MIVKDIWMLDMRLKGEKINLARYMMDKMLLTLKKKEKEVDAKKKSTLHQRSVVL